MDIRAMAKAAGLTENELKGKSSKELIKLLTSSLNEQEKNIEFEAQKEYIGNYGNKLPKVIEALKEPFEVYVKKVGQRKSPATVPVVGYNSSSKSVIVLLSGKLYQVEDGDLIKSVDELNTEKPKATRKPRKQKDT